MTMCNYELVDMTLSKDRSLSYDDTQYQYVPKQTYQIPITKGKKRFSNSSAKVMRRKLF